MFTYECRWGSIGEQCALLVERDHTIGDVEPRLDAMLDDNQRCSRALHRNEYGFSYGACAVVVEHRGRFVEEQHAWPQRQHTREREALRLAAGQRPRRMVDRVRQLHLFEQGPHTRPYLRPRNARVLHAECDIAAQAIGDDSVERVLQQQPDSTADIDVAGQLPRGGRAQHTRQGAQDRGLACTARPSEQYALTRRDVEVEPGDDRHPARDRTPAEAT